MQFVPTTHGNQTLVFNGYIFSRSKVNSSGSINWKCHNYFKKDNTHCKITCTTIGNEFIVGREAPIHHNDANGNRIHDPPAMEKKLAMHMAQEVVEAVPKSTQPLQKIWNKAVVKYVQEPGVDFVQYALSVPQFDNRRQKLIQIRRGEMPLLPRTRETIDLDCQYITTLDRLRFLLFDTEGTDRIIAFASDRQLKCLSRSTKWHSDGTFKSSPELFSQHYIIHGWYEERMFPCI